MKTKLIKLTAVVVFLISGFTLSAEKILLCANGQAYIITAIWTDSGWKLESMVAAGGCIGNYAEVLRVVTPTGTPASAHLSSNSYAALSQITETEDELNEAQWNAVLDIIDDPAYSRWVNPLLLNQDAYDAIYGNQDYLNIFYVHPSINSGTGEHMLNLYSDDSRTMDIEYRNIYGTLVDSESVSVNTGESSEVLTKTTSLPNGFYNVKVITESSYRVVCINVNN